MRFVRIGAIATAIAIGAGGGGGGGAGNVFVSTTGNDLTCARGDNTKPCASLNKALNLALAGDAVQLAAGTYGNAFGCTSDVTNHLFVVSQAFASDVTVTVASGGTAIIPCEVSVGGNHIGFDGTGGTIRIDGYRADGSFDFLRNTDVYCEDAAPYVLYTVTTLDPASPSPPAGGSHLFCSAPLRGQGDHFTMTGGSIGPTTTDAVNGMEDSSIINAATWTLNGVNSHTARWGDDCNFPLAQPCHTENFYLDGVQHFNVRNSVFTQCGDSACVFVTRNSAPIDPADVNFYGNAFADTSHISIDAGGSVNAATVLGTIAYNDMGSMNLTGGHITLSHNVATNNPCPHVGHPNVTITYDHNLWYFDTSTGGSADQCGVTDVLYNVPHPPLPDIFVNFAGGDYHLKSGTNPAVDIGSTSYCLVSSPDYYGVTRYKGAAPDVGAAERVDAGGGACSG